MLGTYCRNWHLPIALDVGKTQIPFEFNSVVQLADKPW